MVDDEEAALEPERLIGPAPVTDESALARSVKDSDREVEDMRRACRNTLRVAGLIYSNAVLRSLWMPVGSVIEVFKHEHRKTVVRMKTQWGALSWSVDMSNGSHNAYLRESARCLSYADRFIGWAPAAQRGHDCVAATQRR